jgi:hypothetical protein
VGQLNQVCIRSKQGIDFYQRIAEFAFDSYLKSGHGAVVINQGRFQTTPTGVNATATYIPYDEDVPSLAIDIREQLCNYNPHEECILCMVDAKGKGAIVTLDADDIGSTPETLYRDKLKQLLGIPFLPGAILRMTDDIGDNEPGYVIYWETEKAMMRLARARLTPSGDIVATESEFEVHMDFVSVFEDTGRNVHGSSEQQ